MEWLASIAPTIATALAGPLGGLAYEAVAKVLNISSDDAQKMLQSGKMNADQIASVQQAEIALKAKAQELGLDFEQLAVADRKSARDMQTANKSIVPPALACLVVLAWIVIQYHLLSGYIIPAEMREIAARLMGTLDAALTLVLSFYFGSSSVAHQQAEMIYNSTPTK